MRSTRSLLICLLLLLSAAIAFGAGVMLRPAADGYLIVYGTGRPMEADDRSMPTGQININTAGLEELMDLPGIGPALGQRILDSRAEEGLFEAVEDLLRVSGIGEKTLEKLRPWITTGRGLMA